jgi:integrase/recombinase XerD
LCETRQIRDLRKECHTVNPTRTPIGERAIQWIERYLEEWRRQRPHASQSQVLYLSEKGYPLRIGDDGQKIRDYKQQADIQQPGGCHLCRHAMANIY